jgi:uncharacterized membrane protein YgcG
MAVYTIDTRPKARPAAKPAPKSASARTTVVASVVGVLLLGGVVYGAWKLWSGRLPSPNGDVVTIAKLAASDRFATLSREQQEAYAAAIGNGWENAALADAVKAGKLTEEERRKAGGLQRWLSWRAKMEGYFALPSEAERQKYLDKLMEEGAKEREKWRAARPTTRPSGDGATPGDGKRGDGQRGDGRPGDRGGWASGSRMKERNESMTPTQRAQMAEFMAAMRKRWQQNGGGGGGGGGSSRPR